MLQNKDYIKLRENLKSGMYKTIRLVKIEQDGSRTFLSGFNKINDQATALKKLDHFRRKLSGELDPGNYEIQAKDNMTLPAVVFAVTVEKKTEPVVTQVQERLDEYELQEQDGFMDKEEFKKMCRELADLKGQVTMITLERDWYKKLYEDSAKVKAEGLADKTSAGNVFAELAKETVPGLINLAEQFIILRKEQALSDKVEKQGKIKITGTAAKPNLDQVAAYFDSLFSKDQEKANAELDALEKSNPNLYNAVCEKLGITFEEGEEEEEEQEEQEEEEEEEQEQGGEY